MGFTEKTLGFISENYMRNDREWFKEHKGDYEALVLAPFAELLETLAPVMEKIDDKLICTPKCVSRIYRDARYVKGGVIFRDSLWCTERKPALTTFCQSFTFTFRWRALVTGADTTARGRLRWNS